jgi:sulfur relay (sulfurtransferase) complex TusBCD TusD component (DsrE family)
MAPPNAAAGAETWDLLVTLTAPPYDSDVVTSVLRLLEAALRRGARVQVWACGYATSLTQRTLGDSKPPDLRDLRAPHPSTAAVIGGLTAAHPRTFAWHVCRFCAEDRGAADHIDGIATRSFSRYARYVAASATTVYVGGA